MTPEASQLIRMVHRDVASTSQICHALRYYHKHDGPALRIVLDTLPRKALAHLYDFLSHYPSTDAGWSLLPAARRDVTGQLTESDKRDIERLPFQEDREYVESLRELLESKVQVLGVEG